MLSTREIRRKIRSVRNIQQICRASKTIAGIKLARAEQRLAAGRRYQRMLDAALRDACGDARHPLLSAPQSRARAIIVITADRGLCGSYNLNVMRRATQEMRSGEPRIIPVGKKGTDFFRRRVPLAAWLSPLGAEPSLAAVRRLAQQALRMFLSGEVGQVAVISTRFLGGTRCKVQSSILLPIEPGAQPGAQPGAADVILEPARGEFLDLFLPRYFEQSLWSAALEASAGEHASRVAAMGLASDNAQKLVGTLTMEFNKARQSSITKELLDIVMAAEALR